MVYETSVNQESKVESSTITSKMSEESINRVASPETESSSAPHAQKKDSSSMQKSVSNMPSQQVSKLYRS